MGIGETAREVGKLAQENEKKEQVPNYRRPWGLGISGLKMWGWGLGSALRADVPFGVFLSLRD